MVEKNLLISPSFHIPWADLPLKDFGVGSLDTTPAAASELRNI
jgi:hypothetical protein